MAKEFNYKENEPVGSVCLLISSVLPAPGDNPLNSWWGKHARAPFDGNRE